MSTSPVEFFSATQSPTEEFLSPPESPSELELSLKLPELYTDFLANVKSQVKDFDPRDPQSRVRSLAVLTIRELLLCPLSDENNLLNYAAREGDMKLMQVALDQIAVPIDPKSSHYQSVTEAKEIARKHNQRATEVFLSYKVAITPLTTAFLELCSLGSRGASPQLKRAEEIQIFLQMGADVNAVTADGETPLMLVLKNGTNLEAVRLLLDSGADVNAVTVRGETPLMFAAEHQPDAVRLLLDSGADVKVITRNGYTPLAYALNSKYNNLEAVRLLLDSGADVNAEEEIDGKSLLAWAILDKPEYVDLFLKHGAKINAADTNRLSSLIMAALKIDNLKAIQLLLDSRADVNAASGYVGTLLMFALENQASLEAVRLLLDNKADVNAVVGVCGRKSALKLAVEKGSLEAVRLLLNYGADIDGELFGYVIKFQPNLVKLLLESGADVNVSNSYGDTPLMYAVENRPELIELLLFHGADINARDKNGATAFQQAKKFNKSKSVKILEKYGGK